jgi:hypothetical protein
VNRGGEEDRNDLESVVRQVRELERRVAWLEQQIAGVPGGMWPVRAEPAGQDPSSVPALGETVKLAPVFGKALLGVAGAYLLRALTEFAVLPAALGVAAGIAYALFWLVLAARAGPERGLLAAVHGTTAVLILMPLLWEAVFRFQAITTWTAAGVLALFSIFGLAISWRRNLSVIAWLTTLAGLGAAVVLLVATYDLAPFTLAILAIAGAVEFCACLDHWLRERWMVALTADATVLLLTYFATRPGGLPEGYAAIPMTTALVSLAALLAIYLSSAIFRTLLRGFTFTGFETTQWALVFALSTGGALRVAHGHSPAVHAVALFILACGAACYTVSFVFLESTGGHNRNFYSYSTFGFLLVFTGIRIVTSGAALALLLSGLGLVCFGVGRQGRRMTLEWHGAVYVVLASLLSGLAGWAGARLLGGGAGWTSPGAAGWIAAAAALAAYAVVQPQKPDAPWTDRLLVFTAGANCLWVVAGLTAGALVALWGAQAGSARLVSYCPTLRTAVLTFLAVLLAWGAARLRRFEMAWLVYPFMVLTAYKLLAQDLRQGETLALFVSLLLYGGALVLLPRILHRARA